LDQEASRVVDPDSIGSVDPDPDSESGSGSRRAKLRAEGFFYNLDIL
jgi:hypothetical protein